MRRETLTLWMKKNQILLPSKGKCLPCQKQTYSQIRVPHEGPPSSRSSARLLEARDVGFPRVIGRYRKF